MKTMRTLFWSLWIATILVPFSARAEIEEVIDHKIWQSVLDKHVNEHGAVDYVGIGNDLEPLYRYISQLKESNVGACSEEEKIAFWINAYNALTVKVIQDHYPVKSIKEIDGVWDRPVATVAGKKVTLNEIEHEILRKNFDEPRIHFALVCASKGCPRLSKEAFKGAKLHEQLAKATQRFLSDPQKGRYIASSHLLKISNIFQWFASDFADQASAEPKLAETYGSPTAGVLAFLKKNDMPGIETALGKGTPVKIKYLYYDWSLNSTM